jgi:hypothetical protein
MKWFKILSASLVLGFTCFAFVVLRQNNIVSYEVSPGRFGDNLLNYLHAKWFAYEHQMPLLYRPFPYSSCLQLDDQEIYYKDKKLRKERCLHPFFKAHVKKWSRFSRWPWIAFHYHCPYFPESTWERLRFRYSHFPVQWKDENFRKMVKECILPKEKLTLTTPPPHCISIAMHVREGGGADTEEARLIMPLKLPPLDFYIEGLRYVVARFPNRPLYCHLFTDALEPEKIVEKMKEAIPPDTLIHFSYRKENNHHDANVLEDFFSFFQFDILIRSQSNYSLIPSLLHDYAMIYAPKDCTVEDKVVKITELEIEINEPLCETLYRE